MPTDEEVKSMKKAGDKVKVKEAEKTAKEA
jgi:hypothetical protein